MKDIEEISDGFTRKKVESLTLGEKLRKLREEYHMTLPEIAKATKIQVKYLEYLENGEYDKLPAEVYTRGFLKGYAKQLGLEEESFLRLYDKERHIQAHLGKEAKFPTGPRLPLTSSFVITSRGVIISLIILVVSGTFFYLFHQFRSFVSEPSLVVLEPATGATIQGSTVVVRGTTDRGARVSVNGQGVFVSNDGTFSQNLVLQSGVNTVTITAVNRFEKEKVETISFDAHFETPQPAEATAAQEKFTVAVTVAEKGAKVTIVADGTTVFSGEMRNTDTQQFEGKSEIKISTDNGKNTLVSFRGGESLPLSDKTVLLENVTYTTNGKQ